MTEELQETQSKPSRRERFTAFYERYETRVGIGLSLTLALSAFTFFVLSNGLFQLMHPATVEGTFVGKNLWSAFWSELFMIIVVLCAMWLLCILPQARLYAVKRYRSPRSRRWLEVTFLLGALAALFKLAGVVTELGISSGTRDQLQGLDVPAYWGAAMSLRAGLLEEFLYVALPVGIVAVIRSLVVATTRKPARWGLPVTVAVLVLAQLALLAGHLYQGVGALPGHALWMGGRAALYLMFRRFWPAVIVHAGWDLKEFGVVPVDDTVDVLLGVGGALVALVAGRALVLQKRRGAVGVDVDVHV